MPLSSPSLKRWILVRPRGAFLRARSPAQPSANYQAGVGPNALAIADLNGDGTPDLAVACNGASPGIIAVLLGNGDGTFGPRVDPALRKQFALLALSPNPSRGDVRVAFTVPREGSVQVSVFDVQGRRVALLPERTYPVGTYEADLNTRSWRVGALPGIYLVRFESPAGTTVRRLVVTQ